MPKNIRLGGNTNIAVGTKSEFTKLLVTHGVVGAETGDISKSIEAFEKLPDRIRDIGQYVKPAHQLSTTAAIFKKKYGTKHPKFLSALKIKFLDPVDEIIEKMQDLAKQLVVIEKQFKESQTFYDNVVKELSKQPLDATSIKAAKDELASAGSLFTNGQNAASLMFNDTGMEVFDKINKAATAVRPGIGEVDFLLHQMLSQGQFSADLKPAVAKLIRLHSACDIFIKMLASAG